MQNIILVDSNNFDEVVLRNEKPVVFAIGTKWCADCRRAAPFYMAFAKEYDGRMVFTTADAEKSPELKERLDVRRIPTMIIFKNGVAMEERLVEVKTPGELKAFIEKGLAS